MSRHALTIGLLLLTTACADWRDRLPGRHESIRPLENAALTLTHRADIVNRFGQPDEIDRRWFEGRQTETLYYHDVYPSNRRQGQADYRYLACEFAQDALTGYVYHDSLEENARGFDEQARAKLIAGKTTQQDAVSLLGAPSGKALPLSMVNLPALDLSVAGPSHVLAAIPESTHEIWFYFSQTLDEALRSTARATLSLFFDRRGVLLGSHTLRELQFKRP